MAAGRSPPLLDSADESLGRPSDVAYPEKVNADGTRRASAWSVSPGSSPEGRRGSILSMFRKNSVAPDGAAEGSKEGDEVEFRDVDMSGRG